MNAFRALDVLESDRRERAAAGDPRYSTTQAERSENRRKNRYVNVLPYDSCRVVLDDGGYLNASFVVEPSWSPDVQHSRTWIAAQVRLFARA
jgi:protein tyrosine phosphatase